MSSYALIANAQIINGEVWLLLAKKTDDVRDVFWTHWSPLSGIQTRIRAASNEALEQGQAAHRWHMSVLLSRDYRIKETQTVGSSKCGTNFATYYTVNNAQTGVEKRFYIVKKLAQAKSYRWGVCDESGVFETKQVAQEYVDLTAGFADLGDGTSLFWYSGTEGVSVFRVDADGNWPGAETSDVLLVDATTLSAELEGVVDPEARYGIACRAIAECRSRPH